MIYDMGLWRNGERCCLISSWFRVRVPEGPPASQEASLSLCYKHSPLGFSDRVPYGRHPADALVPATHRSYKDGYMGRSQVRGTKAPDSTSGSTTPAGSIPALPTSLARGSFPPGLCAISAALSLFIVTRAPPAAVSDQRFYKAAIWIFGP